MTECIARRRCNPWIVVYLGARLPSAGIMTHTEERVPKKQAIANFNEQNGGARTSTTACSRSVPSAERTRIDRLRIRNVWHDLDLSFVAITASRDEKKKKKKKWVHSVKDGNEGGR